MTSGEPDTQAAGGWQRQEQAVRPYVSIAR